MRTKRRLCARLRRSCVRSWTKTEAEVAYADDNPAAAPLFHLHHPNRLLRVVQAALVVKEARKVQEASQVIKYSVSGSPLHFVARYPFKWRHMPSCFSQSPSLVVIGFKRRLWSINLSKEEQEINKQVKVKVSVVRHAREDDRRRRRLKEEVTRHLERKRRLRAVRTYVNSQCEWRRSNNKRKKPNSNTSEEQQQTQAITLQIQSPTMARPHMTYHVCAKTANHLRRTRNVLKCHVTGNDAKAALHHPRSNSSSSPSSSDDNDKRIGRSAKTVTLLLRSAWRHRDICDFHSKRKSVDVPEVFVTPSRSKSGAVAGSSVVKNVEWASEWEEYLRHCLLPLNYVLN